MAPMFRADHVGSLLRPQELKNAFRDIGRSAITQDQFAEIMDRSIRDAIRMQADAGLKSITDGEFRRGSWFYGFVQAVDGLTVKDSLFDFRDSTLPASSGRYCAHQQIAEKRRAVCCCQRALAMRANGCRLVE